MNDFYKTKRIIYLKDNGTLSIIYPSPAWSGTIIKLADKDVPTGKKYKIIDNSDLPDDSTFIDAWEIDESELTDGVGG